MPSLRQREVLQRQWVSPDLKPKCLSLEPPVPVEELETVGAGRLMQGHGTTSGPPGAVPGSGHQAGSGSYLGLSFPAPPVQVGPLGLSRHPGRVTELQL